MRTRVRYGALIAGLLLVSCMREEGGSTGFCESFKVEKDVKRNICWVVRVREVTTVPCESVKDCK